MNMKFLLLSAVLRPRAAAPLLLDANRLPRCRSISPVRTALSSKPAARE